jgi:transcriptional regulator with XRE-family HTH domain
MLAQDFFRSLYEKYPGMREKLAEIGKLSDPPFNLGGNVRDFRDQRGLSQAQLAKMIGVSQPRIAEIERGEANPRLSTIAKLAKALDVSVPELLAERLDIDAWMAMGRIGAPAAEDGAAQTAEPPRARRRSAGAR